jgi:transposase
LAGLVEKQIRRPARSGALFVFFGKRRSALKILFFDGTGLCQFYKRLDEGTFRVPQASHPEATSVEVSERELDALLDGIDVDAPAEKGRRVRVH